MTHIGRTLQILNEMYYLFWLLSTTTYVDFTFHEIYNSYALYNWPNQEASLTSKYRSSKHWRNIHVQTNYIELDLLSNWEIVFEPDNDLASTMLRALAASRTIQSTDSGLNELRLILINRITKCYKMSYDLLAVSYIVMLLCNLGSIPRYLRDVHVLPLFVNTKTSVWWFHAILSNVINLFTCCPRCCSIGTVANKCWPGADGVILGDVNTFKCAWTSSGPLAW